MSDDPNTNGVKDAPMHQREIKLADGRYMIFYTFGDEPAAHDGGIEDQGEDV